MFNIKRGIGISKAISISKTKKITANKKNRREKGSRAEFFGSNPHSKGLDFSRSDDERAERNQAAMNTTNGIKIAKIRLKKNKSIH